MMKTDIDDVMTRYEDDVDRIADSIHALVRGILEDDELHAECFTTEQVEEWGMEYFRDTHPIFHAVEHMLEEINEHGTCLLCEQSYNFHASRCVVHEVRLAMHWEGK